MNYVFILLLAIAIVACGGSADNTKETVNEQTYKVREENKPGEYSMQISAAQGNEVIDGAEFHYEIKRTPSRDLPLVKDEQGNKFVDNVISLKVLKNGKQILEKRFVKKDFSELVAADFLSNSILEGLVFDQVVKGHLRFAASVCYPQTDIYVPFCIMVSKDGTLRLEKGSVLDEEIPSGE